MIFSDNITTFSLKVRVKRGDNFATARNISTYYTVDYAAV
jgi:hypothetical protein